MGCALSGKKHELPPPKCNGITATGWRRTTAGAPSPDSVAPVHQQSLDLAKSLVGFGGVGLTVIHAIEQVEGPRGGSSHRPGLRGGGGPAEQGRELLDKRQDQGSSTVDGGGRTAPDGRKIDDIGRAFLERPGERRLALRLLRFDGHGMTMAGLGHVRQNDVSRRGHSSFGSAHLNLESPTLIPIRIRALRAADIPACATLVATTPLWQRYRYTETRCARDLAGALARRDLIKVAISGGAIVGLAWVLPRGGFGRIPYLKLLAVGDGARNRGVGAALVRAIHQSGDLILLVSDFNRRARRFYAAQGYERVGAIRGLVLPETTEIMLYKRGGGRRPS
jgi:GNAT superfamily N-acetyltransferase